MYAQSVGYYYTGGNSGPDRLNATPARGGDRSKGVVYKILIYFKLPFQ